MGACGSCVDSTSRDVRCRSLRQLQTRPADGQGVRGGSFGLDEMEEVGFGRSDRRGCGVG